MKRSRILNIAVAVLLVIAAFFFGLKWDDVTDRQPSLEYLDVMQPGKFDGPIYVIGHKSPDTDTVISAITYANLKNKLGFDCVPAVSGKINNETRFVLERFQTPVPEILENAAGRNMIIVDYSASPQMIDGMEEAHIVEMIDHHGLGDVTVPDPLYIKCMPVGATATIIYTSYIENEVPFDQKTAGLLASAILSDTNGLTLSTTTDADRKACEYLAKIAKLDDLDTYYAEMRQHAESYDGMTDEEVFYSDYKEYVMSGTEVGIACVNASDGQTDEMCEKMENVMREIYEKQAMRHLYAVVCDARNDRSALLRYGEGTEQIVRSAFSERMDEKGSVIFHPTASRKKDIVPSLERAYADNTVYEKDGSH